VNTLLLKFLATVNPLSLRVAAEVAGDMLADHRPDVETTQPVPAPDAQVFARWAVDFDRDERRMERPYQTAYKLTDHERLAEDEVVGELMDLIAADVSPWDAARVLFAGEAS
jgi:hypothetical protein